jgi:hypothetical protein
MSFRTAWAKRINAAANDRIVTIATKLHITCPLLDGPIIGDVNVAVWTTARK